jgi:HK97 family phage major capsid protein
MRLHTEKGLHFAKLISALAQSQFSDLPGRTREDAASIAARRFPDTPSIAQAARELYEKAAVGAGTPTDAGWADDLVVGSLVDDFVEAVRAISVIDRLQGVRRVPFEARVPKESSAGFGGGWRGGPGGALPAIKTALDTLTLPQFAVGGIMVTTEELALLTRPAHARTLRDLLVTGLARYLDSQFLDPSVTAVANVSPASITNGASQITSSGATAAAIKDDLRRMIDEIDTNLVAPVWIMRRKDAVFLATLETAGGAIAFPNITAVGGMLLGIPVLTSNSIPGDAGSPATDRNIVLLDASGVLLADEGGAEVSVSRVTSLQTDDAPTNNAATGTATAMVSMFQTHSVATKVMRPMNWTRAQDGCAAYMRVSW